jgi:hypothetical protein
LWQQKISKDKLNSLKKKTQLELGKILLRWQGKKEEFVTKKNIVASV